MKKYASYTAIANNPVKTKKPYLYREQLIHNRKRLDKCYEIGQIIAAYLDLRGESMYSFAKKVDAWGRANYGYGVSYYSIQKYIHGVCRPKSEIRDLLAEYMGLDDAFITGYRNVDVMESLLTTRINQESTPGIMLMSRPGRRIETRPAIGSDTPYAS